MDLGEKGILEDFRTITGTKNITKTKEYMEGNMYPSGRFLMVLRGRWKCYHNFDEFINAVSNEY